MSTEEERFNPTKIMMMKDVGKMLKTSKDLQEAKEKLKNYGLTMLGLEDL